MDRKNTAGPVFTGVNVLAAKVSNASGVCQRLDARVVLRAKNLSWGLFEALEPITAFVKLQR